MRGRLTRGIGGFYTALGDDGQVYTLRAQNKLRRLHTKPMIGDYVLFEGEADDEERWLQEILPRRNALVRPPVSNIDLLVLTASVAYPKADLLMLDRLLIQCFELRIAPIIALNKADQAMDEARALAKQYQGACDAFVVSGATGEGVPELKARLLGTTHAFCGQSGVGKSTLINALYGTAQSTGELSAKIERGKHTTRRCELIPTPGGGMVLDTPGFSLIETETVDPLTLKRHYPEFEPYEGACRFAPCAHDKEPDCAVRAAVESGAIDRNRYERYQTLFEETSDKWRGRYD